jgi:YD repeat-containing protein
MLTTRKELISSLGALAVGSALTACGGGIAAVSGGRKSAIVLPASIRHGTGAFPLWPTPMKLSDSVRRRTLVHTIGGGGGDPGSPDDPTGPSGNPPTRVFRSASLWTEYAYRSDNVASLYDDSGDLVLQHALTLNADNTITAQSIDSGGSSTWCTLPSAATVPVNQWCSVLGSSCYINTTANTATVLTNDGTTWTFSRDSANNLIIHTNNGDPDIVIAAAYVVSELPGRRIHTAGLACNAAGFAMGFFGAATVLSAGSAAIASGGRGAGHMAAAAITILGAMWAGMMAVCNK